MKYERLSLYTYLLYINNRQKYFYHFYQKYTYDKNYSLFFAIFDPTVVIIIDCHILINKYLILLNS